MTKEFNLSDKIVNPEDFKDCTIIGNFFWEEDVREFVRLLKEELETFNIGIKGDFQTVISKLAGKKLI